MRSTLPALWDRRHLLMVLVSSQIKRQNRGSLLGYLWWFLDPLLMTAIYFLVIVVLFRRGGGNQPYVLFLVCGLFCFKAFSDAVNQAVTAMKTRTTIIRSISFPKAVLPLATMVTNTVYFGFGLVVIVGIAVAYGPTYGTWPTWTYVMLPLVIIVQMTFTAGVALLVSVLGVYFTDIANITRHLLRIWFYLSPGLFATTLVPERFRDLFMLNPFAGLMESYRAIIMHGALPDPGQLGTAAAVAVAVFGLGYLVFARAEGSIVQKL